MAHFYRLIACLICLLACASSHAALPTTPVYTAVSGSFTRTGPSAIEACNLALQASIADNNASPAGASNAPWSGVMVSAENGNCNALVSAKFFTDNPYGFPYSVEQVCPANSSGTGGNCSCNSGYNVDPTGMMCTNNPCAAGAPVTSTADSPWYRSGDLVSAYSFQASTINTPGCVNKNGRGCTVNWGSPTASPRQQNGSNGHSFFTVYLSGTTTGESCSVVAPTGQPPEPSCAGQSGLVNGVNVCLPPESPAQREERENSAARAAAAAASQHASNQGASTARASAAAAAAAAAARSCLKDPACSASDAAAAARAAADASLAATAAAPNAPASSAAAAAAAASVEQQITQRASSIGTAANLNSAQVSATIEAARTAGMNAYNNALASGLSQEVAVNAARTAGQAATASSIYGATPQATAAAAAAAAAAATAGNPNAQPGPSGAPAGTGSSTPETPVDDFCKRNPQAKMCKTEFDSTFIGSCAAAPVCTGDAVMCAIAAATHKQECNWRPPASAESALFETSKVKTGDQTTSLPGNSTIALGPTSFVSTELLGGASGMQDRTIAVMGQSIVLPFSMVNVWLERLGVVLQAVTFLLCLRIVTRG